MSETSLLYLLSFFLNNKKLKNFCFGSLEFIQKKVVVPFEKLLYKELLNR